MFRLTFDRQLLLSLVLVALVPLGVFALVAFPRFSSAIRAEAARGAVEAVGSVRTLVDQLGGRLSTTTASYATWETVADLVDRMDGAALETDVAQFLVDRGTADDVVIVTGRTDLATAGADADGAALATLAREALASAPASTEEIGPSVATLPSGVNVVSVRRVDMGDRTGPGAAAAADGGAAIATARRLDGAFAIDAAQLTGFAVSIHLPDGTLSVTSDADAAAAVGSPDTSRTDPGSVAVRDVGGYASGSAGILDRTGAVVGSVVASARLDVLNAIDEELVPILWMGLGLSVLAAIILAILLSLRLRRRLDTIAAGIVAVSQGEASAQLSTSGDDGIARLAASHNRLATTLARRETALDRSLEEVASFTADRGMGDLAASGTAAAVAVFGLRYAALIDGHGAVVASARDDDPVDPGERASLRGKDPRDGPTAESEAEPPETTVAVPITPDTWRLAVRPAPGQEWSEGDAALLALYGRQLGAAIRDAQLYADAAERAEELERVARMQGDFLRGVSHNLRTPLTRIEAAAGELDDTHPGDASIARDTRVIRTEGERLSRLVSQLLTLSRLEANSLAVSAEPIAIPAIVRRVAPAAAGRELVMLDDTPGLVPIADEAAVEQVLWMLLDNAARYAPDGPIEVRIESSASGDLARDGTMVAVAVDDHGPGVPVGEREAIFGRFSRGSTAEDTDGSGLGLDVARGLVTAMGGTLRCTTAPGGGARFVFTLPAEDATTPA